ncbi:MAG: hypothetical protein JSR48_03970 [Verrucomicrobia bacterium]|nr:hypothetical protein [Verrucomicrobiota bacterium]
MSDRLNELRRQRALVQEQLTWLDREIAALTANPPPAPAREAAAPLVSASPTVVPAAVPPADFPEYQPDPVGAQKEARRGCLLAASLAFTLLLIIATAIFFFAYRDHPLFFAGQPADRATESK